MQFKHSNPSLARQLTTVVGDNFNPGYIPWKVLAYSGDPRNKTAHSIFQIFAKNKGDANANRTHIFVLAPGDRMGYLVVSITNPSIEQIDVLRKICVDLKKLCYSMSAEDWNSHTYDDQQIRITSVLPPSLTRQNALCNKNKLCHSIERSLDNVLNGRLSPQATQSILGNSFRGLSDIRCGSLRTDKFLKNHGYREED